MEQLFSGVPPQCGCVQVWRRTTLNPSTISAVCLKVPCKWNEAPSQGKVIVLNLIIFYENNRLGPQL